MSYSNIFLSSLLERQLHDAALRAKARENALSRRELHCKARALLDQLTGIEHHTAHQDALSDPQTGQPPEQLARSCQATAFINGTSKNPFCGLDYQQLSLIVYDEGSVFTLNERRAAWSEAYAQDKAWRQRIVKQACQHYHQPQWQIRFFTEVLRNYRALPAIEKAQYPRHYERELQCHILPRRDREETDFSSLLDYPSLLEMLLTIRQNGSKQESVTPDVHQTP